jgi:flagella basal body P-ring formation protein FlgA
MTLARSLIAAFAFSALAFPAVAGPVSLVVDPVDDDGRVTLGELFDNAGGAVNVFVAQRHGASVMLEARQVQAVARQNGLVWDNPQGLRRIVVREGGAMAADASARPASASLSRPGATVEVLTYARNIAAGEIIQPSDVLWSTVQAHMASASGPSDADEVIGLSSRRPLRAGTAVASRDLVAPQVIARNDMVQVAFISDGIELTVTGRATRDAAAGEPVPVMNLQSGRTIDAVAVGPGRAVTGPAAQIARSRPQEFAAR